MDFLNNDNDKKNEKEVSLDEAIRSLDILDKNELEDLNLILTDTVHNKVEDEIIFITPFKNQTKKNNEDLPNTTIFNEAPITTKLNEIPNYKHYFNSFNIDTNLKKTNLTKLIHNVQFLYKILNLNQTSYS